MQSFSPSFHSPPCSLHCNLLPNAHSLKLPPLSVSVKISKSPHFKIQSSLSIHSTSTCDNKIHKHQDTNLPFFDQFNNLNGDTSQNKQYPGSPNRENNEEDKEFEASRVGNRRGIFTNMWWADLKAAVGQRINVEGIVSSLAVAVRDRHLALPHVKVEDIRFIDWAELYKRGFKGVVFDKDNTITVPYTLKLWSPLEESLEQCKSVFGSDIAVFSNSAGLREYDHDGSKARALEKATGIAVIRHRLKKPAGTAEEIEDYFGCESSELIMVGDRPFTDVVYGNRNGFLTILTEPLSLSEEPFIVRQVRKLEMALTNHWLRKGLKPISHRLLPDPMLCVKEPPPL